MFLDLGLKHYFKILDLQSYFKPTKSLMRIMIKKLRSDFFDEGCEF